MASKPDWYGAAVDGCESMSDAAGDAAGGAYGAGAMISTGSPAFAGAVNAAIDHQVTNGWDDMCNLPENLGLVGGDGSGAGDGGSSADDGGTADDF